MLTDLVSEVTTDSVNARIFLRSKRILCPSPPNCPECGVQMKEIADNKISDGVIFRCSTHKKQKKSIRHGSFLSSSHLSLQQFIKLIQEWAFQSPIKKTSERLGISAKTVIQWFQFARDACSNFMSRNSNQIGGPGHVVEIDESVVSRRKYHVGRMVKEKWVFGGIDTTTYLGFIQLVENRSAEVLLPVIQQWILPGTEIHSDGWAAYNQITAISVDPAFTHKVVNHSENFVDAATNATTNHVERMWCKMKRKLKAMSGTSENMLSGHLDEFMWHQMRGQTTELSFHNILNDIAEWYQV